MRVKSVYQSNSGLAHAWANKTLSLHCDRFRANNIIATHDKIYSYGTHFCIAERRGWVVLFTERGRSITTSRHKRIVYGAIWNSGIRDILEVPSLDDSATPRDWVAAKIVEAERWFALAKRARSHRLWKTCRSIDALNQAAKLAETFNASTPTPAALPPGYLDFLAVEAFKAKCDNQEFSKLNPCYFSPAENSCNSTIPDAVAVSGV